ncbi:transcription factor RF2a [Prunus yedoensis var. nudiflora]|uniref:Transcription factor RF2a n=1 Tax=Prunus yedoensis var. nudiflora TaxID=2094558 RepID=A0A314UZL4_PRUYE|nr:transcription factor RF2a [Prunus yedoensis var. nudiflora]
MADSTPPKNHSASSITSMTKNPHAVLADMARHDPKRAKRIMTNRRSAMKTKQRKKMYVSALEYNLERLYCEAAALSARLNLWLFTAKDQRLIFFMFADSLDG